MHLHPYKSDKRNNKSKRTRRIVLFQCCRVPFRCAKQHKQSLFVVFSCGHFLWHLSNSITQKLGKRDGVWKWRLKFSSYLEPVIRGCRIGHVTTNWSSLPINISKPDSLETEGKALLLIAIRHQCPVAIIEPRKEVK